MIRIKWKYVISGLCAFTVLLMAGCSSQKINTKSSVMDYLYPNSIDGRVEPSIPHLKLPLRVGIAFVPESTNKPSGHSAWTGKAYGGPLSEAKKIELLEEVAKNFKTLDFVQSVEVIPTTYLTPGGSFSNLSQIKTMHGVDVIALVSYDQVQFTDEGILSLSYLTLVGAYVVSGEKNDTSTLVDTVVYDIDSKKMLFRAPGTSQVTGRSTPINLSEELRADSVKGFEDATQVMIKNLKLQLDSFQTSLKEDPEKAQISYREGYSGGGAFEWPFLLLLVGFSLWRFRR